MSDRITYQAIADLLSKHFSPEPNVYSNKLASASSNRMFVQGVELWIAFHNKVEEYCHQYPFVVETDVTAYFDHINHDLMLSRISDLFSKSLDESELKTIKELLHRMWGRWNVGYIKNFGIPQINDASSFMGNLYLDELDKWLFSHKFIYLRYVDDIRIFANSEPEARKSLAELIVKTVVTNEHRTISHPGDVSKIASELKKVAKSRPGSVYVKDTRGAETTDGAAETSAA